MRTALQRFDDRVTRQIHTWPRQWRGYFTQMTFIGQPVFALLAAAGVSYYGEYSHTWQLMIAGVVVAMSALFASSLKLVLRRKRPHTDYAAAMFFKTYSFPSGHAAVSISCYGLVAYLCLASGSPLLVAVGVLLIPIVLSIGVSRVYLGAHFPSDVIGGWIFGGIGLVVAIWILHL